MSERGLVSAIMLNKVEPMKEELQQVVPFVNNKTIFNWDKAGTSQKVLGPGRAHFPQLGTRNVFQSHPHTRETPQVSVCFVTMKDRSTMVEILKSANM